MNRIVRPYLLAGLIICIVIFSYLALDSVLSIFVLSTYHYNVKNEITFLHFITFYNVTGIILASLGLKLCYKSYDNYIKKCGIVVITSILICIMVAFLIYQLFINVLTIFIIIIIIGIIGAALTIFGHYKACREEDYLSGYGNHYFNRSIKKIKGLHDTKVISEDDYNRLIDRYFNERDTH